MMGLRDGTGGQESAKNDFCNCLSKQGVRVPTCVFVWFGTLQSGTTLKARRLVVKESIWSQTALMLLRGAEDMRWKEDRDSTWFV